jgi:hypothetical protein
MKTASELATEYWNKPPIERVNTTVQDYVFDYQQKKIDAALEYIETNGFKCDFNIEKIQELLK